MYKGENRLLMWGRWRQQAQLPVSFLALGRVEITKNTSLENSFIERPVLTQAWDWNSCYRCDDTLPYWNTHTQSGSTLAPPPRYMEWMKYSRNTLKLPRNTLKSRLQRLLQTRICGTGVHSLNTNTKQVIISES